MVVAAKGVVILLVGAVVVEVAVVVVGVALFAKRPPAGVAVVDGAAVPLVPADPKMLAEGALVVALPRLKPPVEAEIVAELID